MRKELIEQLTRARDLAGNVLQCEAVIGKVQMVLTLIWS